MPALLLLTACPARQAVELRFEAQVEGAAITCDEPRPLADGRRVELVDLRFYVHAIELEDADGRRVPLALDVDEHQQADLALIDLTSDSGSCRNSSAVMRTAIRGSVAPGDYWRVHFRVGVPFAANHADPIHAEGPLAALSMHWGWQGGYKFLRADLRLDGAPHSVHVGSTGCLGEIGAITECKRANRAEGVALLHGSRAAIAVELAPLLAPAPADTVPGCMAEAGDPGCAPVLSAMGLNLLTGAPSHASPLFRRG